MFCAEIMKWIKNALLASTSSWEDMEVFPWEEIGAVDHSRVNII